MSDGSQGELVNRPAGYSALIQRYGLEAIPNWHRSYVSTKGTHRIDSTGGTIREIYPSKYWPGETLVGHLEFALKYDGTNLSIGSVGRSTAASPHANTQATSISWRMTKSLGWNRPSAPPTEAMLRATDSRGTGPRFR